MTARTLMVQGTMSSVGKSTLVAALCRILRQDGWRVAPFKAQTMALNAAVTADGLEVGRAQAMQAEAAGIEVSVAMNPILLKPEAGGAAQVILRGRPWGRIQAGERHDGREAWWCAATEALDSLRAAYDLVLIEGAGGPAELNLRKDDLANMAIAAYADAPVLLVGDIERGGVFAQLLGTLDLLPDHERARVRGLLVNKFHGDPDLFVDGVRMLEERSGKPVLGVIPAISRLGLPEEDVRFSMGVISQRPATPMLEIAVLKLPHMSNSDDLDPLEAEPDLQLRFVEHPDALGHPDLLFIPGSKLTMADLAWLRRTGLADRVIQRALAGLAILGICGGYQLLGEQLYDPLGVESTIPEAPGLGLLPVSTCFAADKTTRRVRGRVVSGWGLLAGAEGLEVAGYELHHGQTTRSEPGPPLLQLTLPSAQPRGDGEFEGALTPDGWIAGSSLHGLLEVDALRGLILGNLARRKGWERQPSAVRYERAAAYDRLAAHVRPHLNLPLIKTLIAESIEDGGVAC